MLHFLLIDGLNNSANLEISQAFHKISRQLQDTIIYNLIKKFFWLYKNLVFTKHIR